MFQAPIFTDWNIQDLITHISTLNFNNEVLTGAWFIFKKVPAKMYSEELENLIEVIKTKSTKFYLKLQTIEYSSLILSVELKLHEGAWKTLFNINSRNKDKVMTNQIIKFA